MKPITAILTALLATTLLVAPSLAVAAGSVTVMTNASSYTSGQTITISGTASPAPGAGVNVALTVTNPNGAAVFSEPKDASSGSFTDSFTAGGSAAWITGTYTVSAVVPNYTTGTTTFQYTASPPNNFNETAILIQINDTVTAIWQQIAIMNSSINSLSSQHAALTAQLNTLAASVAALSTQVGTIGTSVTSLSNTVTQLSQTVSGMSTQVNAAVAAANAAKTSADAAAAAANNQGSTQTYVLVVAVLAAITLVLELAILVRKIS